MGGIADHGKSAAEATAFTDTSDDKHLADTIKDLNDDGLDENNMPNPGDVKVYPFLTNFSDYYEAYDYCLNSGTYVQNDYFTYEEFFDIDLDQWQEFWG